MLKGRAHIALTCDEEEGDLNARDLEPRASDSQGWPRALKAVGLPSAGEPQASPDAQPERSPPARARWRRPLPGTLPPRGRAVQRLVSLERPPRGPRNLPNYGSAAKASLPSRW